MDESVTLAVKEHDILAAATPVAPNDARVAPDDAPLGTLPLKDGPSESMPDVTDRESSSATGPESLGAPGPENPGATEEGRSTSVDDPIKEVQELRQQVADQQTQIEELHAREDALLRQLSQGPSATSAHSKTAKSKGRSSSTEDVAASDAMWVRRPESGMLLCDPHWACGLGCTTHKFLICLEMAWLWNKPMMLCQPDYPILGGWGKWFDIPRCQWPYAANVQKMDPQLCMSKSTHCEAEKKRLHIKKVLPTPKDVLARPMATSWLTRPSYMSIVMRWDQQKVALKAWLGHQRFNSNLKLASELVASLVKPTPFLAEKLRELKTSLGFVHPIVAVHIRRGDAKHETKFHPVDKYFQRIEQLYSTLRSCTGNCTAIPEKPRVYLMADRPYVFQEVFQKYNNTYEIISIDGGKIKKTWADKLHTDTAIYDFKLAGQADYFIGTAASQLGRLVTETMCQTWSDCTNRVQYVDGRHWYLT